MTSTADIFNHVQDYLNADHDLREDIRLVVRDLEQTAREIQTALEAIYQLSQSANFITLCNNAMSMFGRVQEQYAFLAGKIPENHYYKFNDHWKFVTQRFVYLSALVVYLKEERLISIDEVTEFLGFHIKREDGFHLDLDDYVMGILNFANELSRLAMNAVTAGDYSRPLRISQFIGELHSRFRLLNLKNDALRKSFDGLKNDVKKCEEVVYDLTIRGLVNKENKAKRSSAQTSVVAPLTESADHFEKEHQIEVTSCTDLLDHYEHFPEQVKNRGRCKRPSCTGTTKTKCAKCNLHFCLTQKKNCFKQFHQT